QSDALPVTVVTTGTTTADFNGEEGIGGGTIAYTTAISGIEFGIGTTNGGSSSLADETSWGIAYSAEVGGGATVSLGYSAAETAADNTSSTSASPDSSYTNLNASVAIGDLTVEAASTTYKTTRNDDNASDDGYADYRANNFGVTYAISDTLSVVAQTTAVKGDQGSDTGAATDYKYDATSYGVDYTIATGVALTASFTDYTQSGTNAGSGISGTSTMVRVKVSF
ncbi:hypothetical protein N9C75_04980, partial [Alphaproteobacteria bacterium]|nr:hypothetical protein [Alphaproteobacteria bacterium]